MLMPQQVANDVADVVAEDAAEPTPPSPTPAITPPPPQQETSTPPSSPHQYPIAQPSSPPSQQQPPQPSHDAAIFMDLLNTLLETCTTLIRKVEALEQDKIAQALEITKLKQRVRKLEKKRKLKVSGREIAELDANEDVTLEEVVADVSNDAEDDEPEPAELKEVIEVVTTAKLMTEIVTPAATTITVAPSVAMRRKGVVIRDPEETVTPSIIVHSEPKSKDKGKGILVKRKEKQDNTVLRYQALKRKPQTEAQARKNMMVYLKNMAGFKIDFFKGMSYDDIRPILEKHFNSIVAFLEKGEEQLEEEASKALKRQSESSEQQAAKKKLDEEVEELKTHLQIVPNDEDDVYTEATPLALKKNQRGSYGLAKVKSWKLLESCGVHIITFTTTQMILLVERRYHLTRFTLDQMLNNVRLEVKEENEVSLEFLRFVRRQQQEGYKPDFGVDAVEDFKEYTLKDYYCWLKTYCCWYKLKLLDNAADSKLRLIEESVAADEKMKK
nr:hypothetical protein [Tanacetum cinerariifolium]